MATSPKLGLEGPFIDDAGVTECGINFKILGELEGWADFIHAPGNLLFNVRICHKIYINEEFGYNLMLRIKPEIPDCMYIVFM